MTSPTYDPNNLDHSQWSDNMRVLLRVRVDDFINSSPIPNPIKSKLMSLSWDEAFVVCIGQAERYAGKPEFRYYTILSNMFQEAIDIWDALQKVKWLDEKGVEK